MTALERGRPRPPALAGRWYPAAPTALRAAVRAWINAPEAADAPRSSLGRVPAIIAPHAGHIYSGAVAGRAFAATTGPYARAVVVGPAHRVAFRGVSGADFSALVTPLGALPVDRAALAALEAAHLITCDPAPHVDEHCVEVLLPFVAEALGLVPVLPLLVGRATAAEVTRALDAALRPDDLLVVSTDLSHFHPYDDARARDLATLDRVARLAGDDLDGSDACGYVGVQAALALARARSWTPTVLAYQSSGDTAGDRDSVVGYGAVAFLARDTDRPGYAG